MGDTKKPTNLATTGLFVVMAACRRVSGQLPARSLLIASAPSNVAVLPGRSGYPPTSEERFRSPAEPEVRTRAKILSEFLRELLTSKAGDITSVLVRDGR